MSIRMIGEIESGDEIVVDLLSGRGLFGTYVDHDENQLVIRRYLQAESVPVDTIREVVLFHKASRVLPVIAG